MVGFWDHFSSCSVEWGEMAFQRYTSVEAVGGYEEFVLAEKDR